MWKIRKFDDERQIVYGEVYVPGVPDAHGHVMSAELLETIAHRFLYEGKTNQIDMMHDNQRVEAGVIESFIARDGDPTYIPGSWVAGVHIADREVWKKIKDNTLNGFSFEILASLSDEYVEVEVPEFVEGMTDGSDGHVHRYRVYLDDDGKVVKGETDEVNGHSHEIKGSSVTERTSDHAHRFYFLDELLRSE